MPELVTSRRQVIENVYNFNMYFHGNADDKKFFQKLLKLGWVFVAENVAGKLLFAPSKFAGYLDNSRDKYFRNKEEGADGRESSAAMNAFYGKEIANSDLLKEFKAFLERYDVDRNFDTEKSIKFLFIPDEVFNSKHRSFFISPTHLSGKKREGWAAFLQRGIAAIGWDIESAEGRGWQDIESEIKSRGYANQADAVDAYRVFLSIKPGDIIVSNNVNHGLFGIGVALSSCQYKYGIHHLGNAEEEDGYHHYVDVAWLKRDYLKRSDVPNQNNTDWWEPYGTISQKEHIPRYIFDLLFPNSIAAIQASEQTLSMKKFPLNTILYGPPGTGKTYNTVVKAAAIITGDNFEDPGKYKEAKKLVKHHLDNQDQVEFVTFHQNYSYEDFVAGLRPDTDANSSFLRFTEHRGIFYRINERAKRNWEQFNSGQTFTEPLFEEILDAFLQPLIEDEEVEVFTIARNVSFHITGNNGKGLTFRKKSGGTGHTLSIKTLKELYEGKREYHLQGLGIYFRPVVDRLKQLAAGMRKETGKIALKNYVLIIDEINRANISRVFGELITLLEDDKRLGEENELRLRLPGLPEEELFGVAPNLYIVGTMNTADKSIALIDIALRRRFVFEAMYPNESLLKSVAHETYLRALNAKIVEKKGSADFMIGHAYLMGKIGDAITVATAFNQRIIPLLNEYFYNQRNVDVLALLNCETLPGVTFIRDPFIGAKAVVI